MNYFQPFENSVHGAKFATSFALPKIPCYLIRVQGNVAEKGKKECVPNKFCVTGGPEKVICTDTNATPGRSMHLFSKAKTRP